jgi:Spy/CpxP family protein refolding chaperone
MKRITSIIAGVGAFVIGITLSAWGQDAVTTPTPTGGMAFVDEDGDGICDYVGVGHRMRGRMGLRVGAGAGLGGITLTPEQQTQVDKLKTDYQKAVTLGQALLQTKQLELSNLLRAAQPDQNAISAKIDEISSVRSQLQKEAAAYQVAVRGVLTPEQQAALDARGAGVGAGMGNGRGMMGNGRGMGRGNGGMMGQGRNGSGTSNQSPTGSQTTSSSSK